MDSTRPDTALLLSSPLRGETETGLVLDELDDSPLSDQQGDDFPFIQNEALIRSML